MKIEQRITVKFKYDIYFTRNLFAPENTVLKEVIGNNQTKVLVFVDTGVATSWPGLEHRIGEWFDKHPECGSLVSPAILVPGGEQCKNDFQYLKVIARNMRVTNLDRHSYVIIIGGGAVLERVSCSLTVTKPGDWRATYGLPGLPCRCWPCTVGRIQSRFGGRWQGSV